MSLTQEQIAERDARAKAIVEGWYWQAAEGHNYRNVNVAKTMTLFYESAPLEADILKLVIEWLRTRTGLTKLVVNHKEMSFDTGWDAADAWFATAPGERWQGTESNRVRLYWVLVQAGEATGDGYHIVEDGCRYKVEHKFFWDVKDAPTASQGSSGVSYTIQGLTRDRQTGLYSYVEEKRTRQQQDVAEYTSSITEFEEQKVEQHIGVDQQHESSAGEAASVSDGTIVERIEEKNEDCTKNITNRKRIEKEVDGAQITVQKTLRGKRTRTVHRNQTSEHVTAKVPATIPDGTTVIQEKTPGKRTDVTIDQNEANANNTPISSGDEISAGVTVETDVVSMSNSDAQTDANTQLTAEANKVKRRTYRKNDDGVTTDRETSTTTYTERSGTGSTASGTSQTGGTTVTTTRKIDAPNPETIGQNEPEVNKVVEVDNTPNDHGSFTTLKRTTTHHPQESAEVTWSDDEYDYKQKSYRDQLAPLLPSETSGHKSISFTPNDHGSFNGGYLVKKAKVAAGGNSIKIVQEGLDVRYSKSLRYGYWQWTNGLNETFWRTSVWEYRRFATMRFKYIGLTESAATALKASLDTLFTRNITVSQWNESTGLFSDVSGGADKMARVHTFQIEGDVWGVSVFVNETTTRMRTSSVDASSVFGAEAGWNYG